MTAETRMGIRVKFPIASRGQLRRVYLPTFIFFSARAFRFPRPAFPPPISLSPLAHLSRCREKYARFSVVRPNGQIIFSAKPATAFLRHIWPIILWKWDRKSCDESGSHEVLTRKMTVEFWHPQKNILGQHVVITQHHIYAVEKQVWPLHTFIFFTRGSCTCNCKPKKGPSDQKISFFGGQWEKSSKNE